MTNQAWTPGPWMFEPNGLFGSEPLDEYDEPWPFGYISHRPNMPSPIFELRTIFKFREDELNANAHLIAAAPEMFEALEATKADFLKWAKIRGGIGTYSEALERIDAALSKARGEQP